MVELSVVVPVYGCRDSLRPLHERLTAALRGIGASYEIVLVDDCDRQGSWEVVEQLAREDHAVRAFRFSRNFGQHAAITAGLAQCSGRQAVVMDCDLQDPPEDIPRLLEKAREGYDIVLARRIEKKHSLMRRLASRLFFALLGTFNELRMDGSFGSFSLVSLPVIEAFLRL